MYHLQQPPYQKQYLTLSFILILSSDLGFYSSFIIIIYYYVFRWFYVQKELSQENYAFSWKLITIHLTVTLLEIFAQCLEDLMIHNNLTYKHTDTKNTDEIS